MIRFQGLKSTKILLPLLIISILLVGIVLLVVSGRVEIRTRKEGQPAARWPVFKNEELGYQIHYPPGLTPQDQGGMGNEVLNFTTFSITEEGKSFPVLGIKVVSVPFQDFKVGMESLARIGKIEVEQVSVAGTEGIRITAQEKKSGELRKEIAFPAPAGKRTFRILGAVELNGKDYQQMFEKMIKSFSFL